MADIKGDLEIGKDLRVANKASINSNDTSKTLVVGGTAKFIDVLVSSTQGAYSLPLSAGVSGQLLISTGNGGRFNWRDRDETLYLTETSADQKYIPFIGNITNQTLNLSFNNNVNNLIEIIENTSLRIQTPEHNLISLSYTGVVPEISIGDLTENMSVEINSIRKLRNIVADSSLVFYEHDFVSTFSFPTSQPATSGKALISTKSNGETEWRSIFTEASAQLLINNIAVSALSQLTNNVGFVSAAQFVGLGIIDVRVSGTSNGRQIIVSAADRTPTFTTTNLGVGAAVGIAVSANRDFIFRTITGAGSIQVSAGATEIVVSAPIYNQVSALSQLANDQGFVSAAQFVGGGIIEVSAAGGIIRISAATTQVAVQASALGGGSSVVIGTSANETRYRTFIGAGSIQISAGATTITVSAPIYNQVSALSQLTNNVGFVSAAQFAGLGIINVRVSGTSNGKQIIVSAADRTPTFTTTNLGGAQQVAVSVSANKGFNFRTINGNGIIQVRTSGNVIEVSAADRIPTFTTTNLGGGQPIISKISAQEITQKTLVGVGNLTVSATATEISFSYTPPVLDRLNFTAANFENPNNANWSISALAPATVDSLNNSLTIRAFDDTTEEGVGFYLRPPSDATTITFNFVLRPQTAPGSTRNVLFRLHRRIIGVNSAVSTWSITNLTAISIPNNTNYQYRSQTTTLTSLGITPGLVHLIELSRQGTNGGDTLAGDLNLLNLEVVLS